MSVSGPKGSRTRCRAPVRVGPFRFPPDLVRHWEGGEWVPGPGRVMRVTDAPGPPGPGDVSRVRGSARWVDATVPCAIAADPSLARFVDWDVLARSIPTRPKRFMDVKWDELWAAWYDLAVTGATGASLSPWRDRWWRALQELAWGTNRSTAPGCGLLPGSIALTIPDYISVADLAIFRVSPPDRVIVSGGSRSTDLHHYVSESAGSWEFTDLQARKVLVGAVGPVEMCLTNCTLDDLIIDAYLGEETVPLSLQLQNCRVSALHLYRNHVSRLVFDPATSRAVRLIRFNRCVLDSGPLSLGEFVNSLVGGPHRPAPRPDGRGPDQGPEGRIEITMSIKAR